MLFKVCIFDKINLPSFSVQWPVSLEFCWAEILLDSVNLTMLPLLPVLNGFSFCFVERITLNHKPGSSHDHFIGFFSMDKYQMISVDIFSNSVKQVYTCYYSNIYK